MQSGGLLLAEEIDTISTVLHGRPSDNTPHPPPIIQWLSYQATQLYLPNATISFSSYSELKTGI